jgi:Zn-dependent protease/predicted transcriptional regulator
MLAGEENRMFGKQIKLFKLFDFEVKIDLSWVVVAALVVWSLATGFFPFQYKDLQAEIYWVMGLLGTIGLFASIVIHEFAHSLVAIRYGMPMKGITLFIFGGVAEMGDEPPSPKAEFMMSIVGPLASIGLAILFFCAYLLGKQSGWPLPVNAIVNYLAFTNGLLAGFNLIPAFPLDGGRILRSFLWSLKGDLNWATRISSGIGSFFGLLLVMLGFWRMFQGDFIGGMWMVLIGLFLQNAAKMSYQQLVVRRVTEGQPIERFMSSNPVTVPSSATVEQFVEDYVYRHHFKMFPVIDNERLVGCANAKEVQRIPRDKWGTTTVGELASQCSDDNSVDLRTDVLKALSIMKRTGASRLMVVEQGRLVGIVSLKDLLQFLSDRVALEE